MEIKERNISELIPAEYNPRYITDEALEQLKASIQRFDAVEPVLVNVHPERANIIISGHQRIKAAKSLGLETFPCVELNLDKEKERELNVRMNKNTGAWDWEELATYFDTEELTDWGFTEEELFGDGAFESEEPEAEEDDYELPEEIETDFVLGDLIEIGEHRLLCGDGTDSDQVAKLMDGDKADILVTDPPYGIDLDTDYSKMPGTSSKYEKIQGDESEFDLKDVISISGTKEQYVWGGDYFVNSIDWMGGTQLIWAKRHSEKENAVFGSAYESLWVSYKCKKQIWFIRPINQSSERLGKHPTQKPIECMSRCIEMSKHKGAVYDSFLGSGSTMVACHQLNRKCYGMELDPKYCQVIVDRMLKLDPSLEVKVNGDIYEQD